MRQVVATLAAVLAMGCGSQAGPPLPARGIAGQRDAATPPPIDSSSLSAAAQGMDRAAPPQADAGLSGTVLETMDSGGYTYLRLQTSGGEMWAAVRQAAVKKGSQVTVVNGMPMVDFESKTLKRKFDNIIFGSLDSSGTPGAAAAGAGMDPQVLAGIAAPHAGIASGPADVGEISVKKAESKDARTVAEIFAGKASLKDTQVSVRGKVVKYNPGIMGRNWIHLRDGSGSRGKKDDDITVTTTEAAALGDVVVVRGTVHLDRDFGAGYAYPVMLEDAKITK
jgi:translation initiation factor 1 (eIF-1/SUI1)